jgi:hypothetical protein
LVVRDIPPLSAGQHPDHIGMGKPEINKKSASKLSHQKYALDSKITVVPLEEIPQCLG